MPEMKYLDIVSLVRDVAVISGIQKQISQKHFFPMEQFHYPGKFFEARKTPVQQNWGLYYESIKSGLVTVSTLS